MAIFNIIKEQGCPSICEYYCDRCGGYLNEMFPHTNENGEVLCWDCSFIKSKITEAEYIRHCGVSLSNVHADIVNGKVIVWVGKHAPWENKYKSRRNSLPYQEWRNDVFSRDNYICQICKKRGGKLNAHHYKSYKDHPDLRLTVSNGVTLCEKCHRELHRTGRRSNGKKNKKHN